MTTVNILYQYTANALALACTPHAITYRSRVSQQATAGYWQQQ